MNTIAASPEHRFSITWDNTSQKWELHDHLLGQIIQSDHRARLQDLRTQTLRSGGALPAIYEI